MIRFDCPECNRPLAVADKLAGEAITCKHCEERVEVPWVSDDEILPWYYRLARVAIYVLLGLAAGWFLLWLFLMAFYLAGWAANPTGDPVLGLAIGLACGMAGLVAFSLPPIILLIWIDAAESLRHLRRHR